MNLLVSFILLGLCLLISETCYAEINPKIIALIESSNNPKAFNARSGARGLMQVTKPVLDDYNRIHNSKVTLEQLFDGKTNLVIGSWYLSWLSSKLSSDEEVLIAYNWGIGNLRKYQAGKKTLPTETINYLRKYKELSK